MNYFWESLPPIWPASVLSDLFIGAPTPDRSCGNGSHRRAHFDRPVVSCHPIADGGSFFKYCIHCVQYFTHTGQIKRILSIKTTSLRIRISCPHAACRYRFRTTISGYLSFFPHVLSCEPLWQNIFERTGHHPHHPSCLANHRTRHRHLQRKRSL